MGKETLISSIITKGDLSEVFSRLRKSLQELGFKELKHSKFDQILLTRGKKGILKLKIRNCKTDLKVSLKESSKGNEIDILFDYTIEVPGLMTDNDKEYLKGELLKINHALFDVSTSLPKFYKELKK